MAKDGNLDVLVICGSLRKGSYNAALARMLPKLAPPAMSFRPAPPFRHSTLSRTTISTSSIRPAFRPTS